MSVTTGLTRTQREAYQALRTHGWVFQRTGMGYDEPGTYQRRVLQALVDAGLAEWSPSGVLYPVGTHERQAYSEEERRQAAAASRRARITELLGDPEKLAAAVTDLELALASHGHPRR